MSDLITKISETPLDIYAQEAKRYILNEFIDNHKNADFLVSHGEIKTDNPMETQPLLFHTQAGGISDWARGEHADGSVVYEIPWHKMDWDNLYMRKLWVGRAPNCAIQIIHKNISKLHGAFLLRGKKIIYKDADSTNGSKLGKRPLEKHTDVEVTPGSSMSFGNVKFTLYSAEGFYNIVSKI